MRSSAWDSFVVFIIFVKTLFVVLAALDIYFKVEKKEDSVWGKWVVYWKDRLEFIFIISMSIICIVLFNPITSGALVVDGHVRFLLFVYGFIILITSNWHTFFGEMPAWFKTLQNLLQL
jgi:amino acid transporter